MNRYLKVRSAEGCAVAHPYAASRRYVGKMPNTVPTWAEGPAREDGAPAWAASKPVAEIIAEDREGYLRKMVRKGSLVLLGECVAASPEDAEKMLAAVPPQE